MLCDVVHITRTFPEPEGEAGITVLNDLSLSLDTGQSLAIIGPSGSGKTTLLNIITTLDKPDIGTVYIDGQDVSMLKERDLARMRNSNIGIVFQKHYLLPQCTLLENILIPTLPWPTGHKKEELMDRAMTLLTRVGLSHRVNHMAGQMSGGECQRTAVVRALINKPSLVCADEPTGSLDRLASDSLGDLLTELNQEEKTALLVVTHSSALARRMDRRLTLINGKCVEVQ